MVLNAGLFVFSFYRLLYKHKLTRSSAYPLQERYVWCCLLCLIGKN
jgi:hypothetical protein